MTTRKVEENTKAIATDDTLADTEEDSADNVGGAVMADRPGPQR